MTLRNTAIKKMKKGGGGGGVGGRESGNSERQKENWKPCQTMWPRPPTH